jgi:16S rRNA (cytosine967-C5)-methyltransferase
VRDELIRQIVEDAVDANVSGERADRALAAALRAHRDLSSQERKRVAEWMLGIALWRGRLDQLAGGRRDLWLGLFLLDREHRTLAEAMALSGSPADALTRALQTTKPSDPTERLAFERSLPPWLARRWAVQLGLARADALAAAMNERGPISIRANTHRTDVSGLLDQLASEGVSCRRSFVADTALLLVGRPNIVALQAWRAGLFEVQDEGSQLIATSVEARPGETIIDLCAGAGGKTLALAAAMRNSGRLIAVDVDARRLNDLDVRARRAGVTCVERRVGDATAPSLLRDLAGVADAVLIDAPCSSLGTLRRGPDARWRLPVDAPELWAPVQEMLLHVGEGLVRPGGRLVYATCSIDPAENEAVSRRLTSPAFSLAGQRTVWPDVEGCDGFFWSVWQRDNAS